MARRASSVVLVGALFGVFGCSATLPVPDPPGGYIAPRHDLDLDEARSIVKDWRASRGLPRDPSPVTSLEEVRQIIRADAIERFERAQVFLQDPGDGALILRAALEVHWAISQRELAAAFDQLAKQTSVEIRRLEARERAGQDTPLASVDELRERNTQRMRTRDALRTLALHHLHAGRELVQEALHVAPGDPASHLVAALHHAAMEEWTAFEREMVLLEGEGPAPRISVLRGMEAAWRHIDREEARARFRAALEQDPGLVRAWAELVILEEDPVLRRQALGGLRGARPRHPLVVLLES